MMNSWLTLTRQHMQRFLSADSVHRSVEIISERTKVASSRRRRRESKIWLHKLTRTVGRFSFNGALEGMRDRISLIRMCFVLINVMVRRTIF
jgi:hypothetical protein